MFNIFSDSNTWKGHVSACLLVSWKQLPRPWPRKWGGEIREIGSRWLGGRDSTEDVDHEERYRGLWDFMKAGSWVNGRWGRWRDPEASSFPLLSKAVPNFQSPPPHPYVPSCSLPQVLSTFCSFDRPNSGKMKMAVWATSVCSNLKPRTCCLGMTQNVWPNFRTEQRMNPT